MNVSDQRVAKGKLTMSNQSDRDSVASHCSTAEFRECYISKFMGGEFRLKEIRTVGDLRRGLQSWIDELGGWGGDDAELYECEIMRDRLIVVLKDGVVQ